MANLTATVDISASRIADMPGSISRIVVDAVFFCSVSARSPTITVPRTIALPTLTAAPTTSKAATLGTTILARHAELHDKRFVAGASRTVSTLTTKVHASYARYVALSASSPLVVQKAPANVAFTIAAA